MASRQSNGEALSARVVYGMVPPAALALAFLRIHRLIAPVSLWLLALLIGGGVLVTTLVDRWYEARRGRFRLNVRIASQVAVTTAIIYATGWGPMLAIGYLFVVQENIASSGARVWKLVAWWSVAGLVCGEAGIAVGWVPSFVGQPAVHGLAVLVSLGLTFVTRLIGETALAKEQAQADVQLNERRFRSLVQKSSDVICVLDNEFRVAYVSEAIERLTGYPPDKYLGGVGFDFVHPDDTDRAVAVIAGLLSAPELSATIEARVLHRDGQWRWIDATVTNLIDDPSVNGIAANFHDVTESRQLAATLEFGAYHDALTGLPNRRAFFDQLERALAGARRHGTAVGVLFCDLDRFKLVNDSLGHAVGDHLLVAIAHRLSSVMRREDVVARFAGDEFAILLPNAGQASQAVAAAERALACLEAPVALGGGERKVTVSIGIAMSDPDDEPGDLLREADLAMYQAKERGRGGWSLFDIEAERRMFEAITMEAELWQALENQELVAFFQPEIDLETGQIVGAEALARWQHPRRGMIGPDTFIPLAEESNLVLAVDRLVLRSACVALAEWRSHGVPSSVTLSVNLSPRWFRDSERIDELIHLVGQSSVCAADLQLEITEHSALGDGEQPSQAVADLRAAGFRIAIDDFGAGYSSMAYLSRFPIDALKLDRAFVAVADRTARDAAILRAMVSLGQALGVRVIAEGVERPAQLKLLRAWGCDAAQGYLFAPAVPGKELQAMLLGQRVDVGPH